MTGQGRGTAGDVYLYTIYRLDRGCGVRITDIATWLSVSRASACKAVQKLELSGLAARSSDRRVLLTSTGKHHARQLEDRVDLLYTLLVKQLCLNPAAARSQAEALALVMSAYSLQTLQLYLAATGKVSSDSNCPSRKLK